MSKVRLRFAPSPTGLLHVGNIRICLLNYLYAKKHNGKFLLRIDDTDIKRSKEEYKKAIIGDLSWLGIDLDETFCQSERIEKYNNAAKLLKEKGILYPCYESKEELALIRKTLIAAGKPPIYNRQALDLSKEQIEKYKNMGKIPHWRFKLSDNSVEWDDIVRGQIHFKSARMWSDPILIKEDGSFLYMLPSIVDDLEYNISSVLRGEDHISNTAIQIEIIKALNDGKCNIEFGHFPLITSQEAKISKREESDLSIKALREKGIEPIVVSSLISTIGMSKSIFLAKDTNEIIKHFEIKNISKSMCKIEVMDFLNLNRNLMKKMDYNDIKNKAKGISSKWWQLVRDNIETINEIDVWEKIIYGNYEPVLCDKMDKIKKSIPKSWSIESIGIWLKELKKEHGIGPKSIRLLFTGIGYGPPLSDMLHLIGKDDILNRIDAAMKVQK